MAVNRIAYFLAGAVLGASGLALVKSGKGQALLSGIVQGGYGVSEGVLARIETLKEDIEDYMAEARFNHEQKAKAEFAAEQTSAPAEEKPAPAARKAASGSKTAAKKAPAKAGASATRTAKPRPAAKKTARAAAKKADA